MSPPAGAWGASALAFLIAVTVSCARSPSPAPDPSSHPSGASGASDISGAQTQSNELSLGRLLSGAGAASLDDGFARATSPIDLSFLRDHGPHPQFRTEWWYFTGILAGHSARGEARRFGYQFTIFRQALAPGPASRESAWATRDVFMGHLAISDIDGDPATPRFHAAERFARDGLALAGARAQPFAVWVDSWRMEGAPSGADIFPIQLRATATDKGGTFIGIELSIAAGRGPILQGERGFSVKGSGAGNASFYYSCTRLATRGRLIINGEAFDVSGSSWLDREWSTSALDADVAGWDWFGVHLEDRRSPSGNRPHGTPKRDDLELGNDEHAGSDLMVYRLRTRDGRATANSRATLIAPDGTTRTFGPDVFSLTTQRHWESPDGRARYPVALRLEIPSVVLDVTINALLDDQELLLAVRYWEGVVAVAGSLVGQPVGGFGYLELTGYATQKKR